jgi:hypothetical protein
MYQTAQEYHRERAHAAKRARLDGDFEHHSIVDAMPFKPEMDSVIPVGEARYLEETDMLDRSVDMIAFALIGAVSTVAVLVFAVLLYRWWV